MHRLTLEKRQVWIYLLAIAGGLLVGSSAPEAGPYLEQLVWPVLAMLLYATFCQVPLLHVRSAFSDRRFVLAVLLGNFVLVPCWVWVVLGWLPGDDPALRLGIALVLLMPCTDWFITFTQLGRGDTARAMAITPLNLLAQLILLPFYLWLMLPPADFGGAWQADSALFAALVLIGIPLAAAMLTERWTEATAKGARWRDYLGWGPVPLLATVLFLIATSQVGAVRGAGALLPTLLPVFIGFLLSMALFARGLAWSLRLPTEAGRTLAFSLTTRNSFLVLPLALTLPGGWEVAVVVIVFQSLIELIGMVIFLRWVPGMLFPRR